MRRYATLLLSVVALGCPADRVADKTLRGSTLNVPPPMQSAAPPALAVIAGLRAPESALHDPAQDVYFVSNVNGALLERDNNGFITRVNAATLSTDLQWIAGGRNGVTLDAPKGMAILGDTLYVSDVTGVRKFDRRTGAPLGEIALPGAMLINDLATDGTSVYASDTGLVPGAGQTFAPTGSDAIWKIDGDQASRIASGASLGNPNGIAFAGGRLWVVTFGGDEIYALRDGKRRSVMKLPERQLDGLVPLSDGTMLVSSWQGDGIYRGSAGAAFVPILAGIDAPADIGYDTKRRRLLVPSSATNQLTIHTVH